MLNSPKSVNSLDFARISNTILRSARSRIDRFELELLKILREELDLLACSFYSLNPFAKSLSLRGQVGLAYDDYESFSLSIDSAAGKAFRSSHALSFSNLLERADYRDKTLIRKFGLTEMIVLPIGYPFGKVQETACSLCLYPKAGSNISELSETTTLIDTLKNTIEIALQVSMDFTSHLLRRELVSGAIHVSDAASFLHKMLQLLKQWNFEAGSVFLFDQRANCLRLAATTGIPSGGLPKRNIFYRLTEIEHQTVKAFINQEELVINKTHIHQSRPKYREKLDREFHSALVSPFFRPKQEGNPHKLAYNGCLGVIRLVNRQIIHGSQIETADFTWEDRELVRFLCDLLGVVTHLYQRVAQKGNDFERIVHGFETSILTVIGALHNIAENVDYARLFPPELIHSIPGTIAFTESMHEQIRVFKMRDVEEFEAAQLKPVKLYGEIIAKITPFARNSAQFYGVENVTIDRDSFVIDTQVSPSSTHKLRRVQAIPLVHTDPDLLLSVIKNLVENAVKYSRTDSSCAIKLDWTFDADFVEIFVSDAGIGVPIEDEEFIFNETYQAENAMRRRTQGTGIGLYQCRLIMEKLGGSVIYKREVDNADGYVTTFVIRIPIVAHTP